jgi:group II intron reverse transcriptase/maturase
MNPAEAIGPGEVSEPENSRSAERVEHPTGQSVADTASRDGHQPLPAGSASGGQATRPDHFHEGQPTPGLISPGPARSDGQKDKRRKAHSLIDNVYCWSNLYKAWRKVRANKGAHGLDRVTIHQFEANWEIHLQEIRRQLREDRFKPHPVRRVYIPKTSDPKQLRPLGIPVVADRVVQQAILQVLDPLFDAEMSNRSFGFRRERRAHDAMATVIRDGKDGYRFVLDADIVSFFDRLDHQVVMSRVRERIADRRVLALIEAFLKAPVHDAGTLSVPTEGSPQGGVISPWLANLVLDGLDKALESNGFRHVRYADDFVVLCTSSQQVQNALALVKEVLEKLKLSLHETKTRLTDFRDGFEFLGFRFRRYRLGVRIKTLERFKDKVRLLTRRQQGRNVEAVLAELAPVLRGFARYFGIAEVTSLFLHLDAWIRMRIRAFKTKRRCRNNNWRIRNRRLVKWGLLSLQECRPKRRLSYMRADARGERSRLLAMRTPRGVAQCSNPAC